MRSQRSLFALVLLGVSASLALAQEPERELGPPEPAPSIIADDEDNTPINRYAEEANEALNSMRGSLRKGLDELKKARDEKDDVRVTCVNEPVAAMKGVLRVAEDANVDLQEAVATNQTSDGRRTFRKVKKSRRRMDDLLSEAQSCAGANSSVSTSSVEVTIDEDVIAIDPYYSDARFFFDPAGVLATASDGGDVRPPAASGII